ncbi:hypothetical protein L3Q82_003257 [Scortum barcoo]|uniref:Uncharacterized protein n=1 Tax=Scortum barcoo TaxID=214431 RepID=A0ACB8VRX6_9TELE|nr:hypothetical protein L3Q82_003257 [Scortum barcoo]
MMLSCWLHQARTFSVYWRRFAAECEAAGMRISTSKSEAMVLDRKRVACPLQVGGEVLPQVEEFKYLGVLFTSEGKMEREIDRRIGAASAVMRSVYRTVVVKKELSRKAKLSIYRSIYVPTLTYGHELWACSRHVPPGGGPVGKTQDTLERLCLSAGLGNASEVPLDEELEEVSGTIDSMRKWKKKHEEEQLRTTRSLRTDGRTGNRCRV